LKNRWFVARKNGLGKIEIGENRGKIEPKHEIGEIDKNHLCIETEHGDPRECFGVVLAWRHFGAKKKPGKRLSSRVVRC